jgi:NADH dehydrogenase
MVEIAHLLSLGMMPKAFLLTRDQVALLQRDNVVSPEAVGEGRTLQGLGITPTTIEAVVPEYLVRFRKTGQFDSRRNARFGSATPDDLAPASTDPASGFDPGVASGPAIGERAAG